MQDPQGAGMNGETEPTIVQLRQVFDTFAVEESNGNDEPDSTTDGERQMDFSGWNNMSAKHVLADGMPGRSQQLEAIFLDAARHGRWLPVPQPHCFLGEELMSALWQGELRNLLRPHETGEALLATTQTKHAFLDIRTIWDISLAVLCFRWQKPSSYQQTLSQTWSIPSCPNPIRAAKLLNARTTVYCIWTRRRLLPLDPSTPAPALPTPRRAAHIRSLVRWSRVRCQWKFPTCSCLRLPQRFAVHLLKSKVHFSGQDHSPEQRRMRPKAASSILCLHTIEKSRRTALHCRLPPRIVIYACTLC